MPRTALRYSVERLPHGRTRWLTHREISAGVLEAIEREQAQFVVGTRWHLS